MMNESDSTNTTPPPPPPLTQQAFEIARKALNSAASIASASSLQSFASTNISVDSDVVPDYIKYQQQQRRITMSPYHAPAFILKTNPMDRHQRSTTPTYDMCPKIQLDESKNETNQKTNQTLIIEPKLKVSDGSKSTNAVLLLNQRLAVMSVLFFWFDIFY